MLSCCVEQIKSIAFCMPTHPQLLDGAGANGMDMLVLTGWICQQETQGDQGSQNWSILLRSSLASSLKMSSSTRYTSSSPQLSASSAQKIHRESTSSISSSSSTARGNTSPGELRLRVRMRRCLPWAITGRVWGRGTRELWSRTERVSSLRPMPEQPAFSLRRAMSSSFQASKMQWISMLSTSQRSSRVWLRRLQLYFSRCTTYRSSFSPKQYSRARSSSCGRAGAAGGAAASTAARKWWMAALQTSCPMMNSYLPISSQELSSSSSEKSMRMQRSSSVGSGQIFWLSLALSASGPGKCCSSSPRNCSRSPSVTARGFTIWLFSNSRSANSGRSSSSPVASQTTTPASHSASCSARGLHRAGEASSISQISRLTCCVIISWFTPPSSACCCRSSSSLIITLRPRSAISPASSRSGCARRNRHSSSSLNSRSLLSASEDRLMWTPSEDRPMWVPSSGYTAAFPTTCPTRPACPICPICRGRSSSRRRLLSSSMTSRSCASGCLQRSPSAERETGRSQPSLRASVTACWARRWAARQPLEMSSRARSMAAFWSVYFWWMAWRRSRNASCEMALSSRSRFSRLISSTSRFFSSSSRSSSISSTWSSGGPESSRFNCPLLSKHFDDISQASRPVLLCGAISTFSSASLASVADICLGKSERCSASCSLWISSEWRQSLSALRALSLPLLSRRWRVRGESGFLGEAMSSICLFLRESCMSCCMKGANWESTWLPICTCSRSMISSHRDACSSFSRSTSPVSTSASSAPFSVASPSISFCLTLDSSLSFSVASLISSSSSPLGLAHSCFFSVLSSSPWASGLSSSPMGSALFWASLFLGWGCCELFLLSMYSSLVSKMMWLSKASWSKSSSSLDPKSPISSCEQMASWWRQTAPSSEEELSSSNGGSCLPTSLWDSELFSFSAKQLLCSETTPEGCFDLIC